MSFNLLDSKWITIDNLKRWVLFGVGYLYLMKNGGPVCLRNRELKTGARIGRKGKKVSN
ncbi:hypothetical protein QNH98_08045 [Myroides sp. mNGS23_01]|nr:hypothetical protein [Myroides sp. mNGS23_01]WHT40495.1 hypothetical protein QNH98_08045 [Myroides sp. mNGS23_01]